MKPKRLTTIIIASSAFASFSPLHAEATTGGSKHYELKNRSNFRIDPETRVPFWPIGWKKPKVATSNQGSTVAVAETNKIRLEPDQFSVTSILLGHPPLATINGRTFEEGEILPVVWGTQRLRVVVQAIRDGRVHLEYEGQQIVVPINRPELGPKQAEKRTQPSEFTIKLGPK